MMHTSPLMENALLRATVATLVAYGGGAIGVGLGRLAPRRLKGLVYAALGGLLLVTALDVLPDARALLTWPQLFLAAASGYALFWALGRYVYHVCPACAFSAFDAETTRALGRTATLLLVALGFHCTMDGLAVVVGDAVAGRPDFALLLAVSFHKLPEGLALSLLLLGAGYTRRAAFWWTIGIESTTELGALLGVVGLRHVPPLLLGLLLAHVGGGFVYLVLSALSAFLPRRRRAAEGRREPPGRSALP